MHDNGTRAPPDEITPESVYFNRRQFLRLGVLTASVAATGYVYRKLNSPVRSMTVTPQLATLSPTTQSTAIATLNPDDVEATFDDITHYNNFYEFSTSKEDVAAYAANFVSKPWTIHVGGLCSKPRQFDLNDIAKIAAPEQRIYRMRCVEAWSMVVPWDGFSLSKLLDIVKPLSSAKYVAFETLLDPTRMPNQSNTVLNWPYVEGLRMDEAMHPLTILATGLYGRELPPQDGAPIRLVVPWKYGFKGIKSIVRIGLVADQPPTTWNIAGPDEYGFYSNVNPEVDHPRWSQAHERRLANGLESIRPTLMFNGYADQVASLYAGMDLRVNF